MACVPHETHLGLMNRKRGNGLPRFLANSLGQPVERWCQPACKPGSVGPRSRDLGRGGHSSGTIIADRLKQPTRTTSLETGLARTPVVPIRFCSRWGLPCRPHCCVRGALLPHPFTLTPEVRRPLRGGLLSVALSLGFPPPDVIRHRASMEPGLSSPRRSSKRPPGRLTVGMWCQRRGAASTQDRSFGSAWR